MESFIGNEDKKMKHLVKAKSIFHVALLTLVVLGIALNPVWATIRSSSLQDKPVSSGVSDDIVLEWNEIALRRIFPNGPPFTAARFMTMTQLAVYEAHGKTEGRAKALQAVTDWIAGATLR